MNDDFNTAETIACLFDLLNVAQKLSQSGDRISEEALSMLKQTYSGFLIEVLGISPASDVQDAVLPEVMDILLELRQNARAKKDFPLSDYIRDRLATIGIQVNDSKEKASYEFSRD
ncbi:MAG: DALR domain-containing protein [Bacteroidota bacterium]